MKKSNLLRFLLLLLAAFALGATQSQAQNAVKLDIIVCSNNASDQGIANLVKEAYGDYATVDFTPGRYNSSSLSTTMTARLKQANLIVFARTCTSTNFCNATANPIWNGLTCPEITLSSWLAYTNTTAAPRWDWINQAAGPAGRINPWDTLTVVDKNHAIFQNVVDSTTDTVKFFSTGQDLRYFNIDWSANNGVQLAKAAPGDTSPVIAYWAAGTKFHSTSTYTPAGKRLLLALYDDNNKDPANTANNLDQATVMTAKGKQIFKNALLFMCPLPPNAVKSAAMFD